MDPGRFLTRTREDGSAFAAGANSLDKRAAGYSYIQQSVASAARFGVVRMSRSKRMSDFRNVDGTLRVFRQIAASWDARNITRDAGISFDCGAGWRASEALIAANLMGYKNITVDDGGWLEMERGFTNRNRATARHGARFPIPRWSHRPI